MGKGGTVAPSERIVMGGIGLGGRGSGDLGVFMAEPEVQFVAVCEVRKSQREAIKSMVEAKYGTKDCATYSDIRQFLAERKDIDAVLIATGDRWHAPASIMAMRAGKDVFCEKPSCFHHGAGPDGRRDGAGVRPRLSDRNAAAQRGRTTCSGSKWRAPAGWERSIPSMPTSAFAAGLRHDWLPAEPEPPKEEVDWDVWLGPCPWRPYNKGYVSHGWYGFYDFATDVAMWGAHTVAQALAGIDMSNVTTVEFEYDAPNSSIVTRLSNGIKMVLVRGGDLWGKCDYWHGSCGERFDGPEGWVAAADGYSKPDVLLARPVGRIQEGARRVRDPDAAAAAPCAGFPQLRPLAADHGRPSRSHVQFHGHLPGRRYL